MVKSRLKASSHDATCCMQLSFWRMKTTASAIISVCQLWDVKALHTFTQLHKPKYESHATCCTM